MNTLPTQSTRRRDIPPHAGVRRRAPSLLRSLAVAGLVPGFIATLSALQTAPVGTAGALVLSLGVVAFVRRRS